MTIPISILSGVRLDPVPDMVQVPPPRNSEPLRQVLPTAIPHGEKKPDMEPTWETSVLAEINESLKLAAVGVEFEFDRDASIMIAKVVDIETGKLIRQMPSEEVMQLSKALGKLHDLLVHQAICRKAQAADNSQAPAPARWRSPWMTTGARGPEAGVFGR